MVTETGEATARFLKSIARGEIDPKDSITQQAQLGLKRVRSMRAEDRPSDCRMASRQLVRSAPRLPALKAPPVMRRSLSLPALTCHYLRHLLGDLRPTQEAACHRSRCCSPTVQQSKGGPKRLIENSCKGSQ